MDLLREKEFQKYNRIWDSIPEYRSFSVADYFTPLFLTYFKDQIQPGDSIIDFGCGTGRSARSLLKAGLKVQLVDFCPNCLDPEIFLYTLGDPPLCYFSLECLWDLSDSLQPADWGICFDVLEHIPEEKMEATLHGLSLRIKKGGLLNICSMEDNFGKGIGETLHLTVKNAPWWKEQIKQHFLSSEVILEGREFLTLAVTNG